jgi:DNA-binding MarR family transcriptional regulator
VNALAARARTSHSTVSTVVRRLERAKLATRTRSPADGRSVLLSITPAGRRLLKHAPAAPTAEVLRALARLSDGQARTLARALGALVRTLRLTPRPPGMLFEQPALRRRRN